MLGCLRPLRSWRGTISKEAAMRPFAAGRFWLASGHVAPSS